MKKVLEIFGGSKKENNRDEKYSEQEKKRDDYHGKSKSKDEEEYHKPLKTDVVKEQDTKHRKKEDLRYLLRKEKAAREKVEEEFKLKQKGFKRKEKELSHELCKERDERLEEKALREKCEAELRKLKKDINSLEILKEELEQKEIELYKKEKELIEVESALEKRERDMVNLGDQMYQMYQPDDEKDNILIGAERQVELVAIQEKIRLLLISFKRSDESVGSPMEKSSTRSIVEEEEESDEEVLVHKQELQESEHFKQPMSP